MDDFTLLSVSKCDIFYFMNLNYSLTKQFLVFVYLYVFIIKIIIISKNILLYDC